MGTSASTSVLREGAAAGDLEKVKACVSLGLDINKSCRESGKSALAMAASGRNSEVVKYLLQHGALVNCQDECHRTPLREAARAGDPRVVAMLCEAGAAVDMADRGGQTPLHAAVIGGHTIVVRELLARGAAADAQDQIGSTALLLAIATGDMQLVELLLQVGASVHIANHNGVTPLHAAAGGGSQHHETLCRLLIALGADTSRLNADGRSPADLARMRGRLGLWLEIIPNSQIPPTRNHAPPAQVAEEPLVPVSQGGAQDHLQWLLHCLSSAGSGLLYGIGLALFTLSKPLLPPHAICNHPDKSQAQTCVAREGPCKEVKSADTEEPPSYILCPITLDVFLEPVLLLDGHTYEASVIKRWLETGKKVSPLTGCQLASCQLIPNRAIKDAVEEWRKKHPLKQEVSACRSFCKPLLARWARFRFRKVS